MIPKIACDARMRSHLQIGRIELGASDQSFFVQHRHPGFAQIDELFAPQRLQAAIDMHRREAERIRYLALCKRQLAALVVGQSDRLGPRPLLAKEMSDTSRRRAAA
jgi:hypothetical protein